MSTVRPVLIMAGTPRVVVAIARCLSNRGIPVDVAQSAVSQQASITSNTIRLTHYLPDFVGSPEGLYAALDALLAKYDYEALIPTTDESLIAIQPFYDKLRHRLYPGCPEPAIVNAVLDKRCTLETARQCGIRTPREYQFPTLAELDNNRGRLAFPLVAKPGSKFDDFNFDLHHYQTFEQLRAAFDNFPQFGSKYILQEYCRGYGVGIELLIWEGKVHAVFEHCRLKELPADGGVAVLCEALTPDPNLVEEAVRLLQVLKWQGVAMVEFRHDPYTGANVLMEVNGRYWGSLPLSMRAGLEFPFYELQLSRGCRKVDVIRNYTPGLRTLWRTGDLMRFVSLVAKWKNGHFPLNSLLKEAVRLCADCCSLTPDAIWRRDDPKPAVAEFKARIFRDLVRPRLLKLLPIGLRRHLRIYRCFGVRLGIIYTCLRVFYAPGFRRRDLVSVLASANRFLFLCSGNIIRSPFAAQLFKQYLSAAPGFQSNSAGLFADGERHADPVALIVANEMGISLDHHHSRTLTPRDVQLSDIIFVMDYINEAAVLSRFPRARRKIFLLTDCRSVSRKKGSREIVDPYQRGVVEVRRCFADIRGCIEVLVELLKDRLSACQTRESKEKITDGQARTINCLND